MCASTRARTRSTSLRGQRTRTDVDASPRVSTPRSAGSPPSLTECGTQAPSAPDKPRPSTSVWNGSPPMRSRRSARPAPCATASRRRRSGRDILQIDGLTKTFGDRTIWSELAFALRRDERLLVLGLNGAGKTTLLRILAGLDVYDAGDVVFGTGVSVGYYAQEHEGITAGTKVIDHLRHGTLTTETEQRGALGAFGLTDDVAFQDAGTLSGGEKTKLALAQLVAGRHNLLLLDEPTNNLDPPSRSAIGTALSSWPGTIVLVSHDVEFVGALAPDIALLLPEGTLDYWSNDLLELVPLA